MNATVRLLVDIAERTCWTWAEWFASAILVAHAWPHTRFGAFLASCAISELAWFAVVPASFTLAKCGIAQLFGNRHSAATLPARID